MDFSQKKYFVWQRVTSFVLAIVIVANTGLFSGVVYAQTFEVKLNEFSDKSPEDLKEFGLVNVLVETELMSDSILAGHIRRYCDRIQAAIGTVCVITKWKDETPSRIVEAQQQLYFEGLEVDGGLGKLVGIVVIGDVPLPVVHNGLDSFPSFFPYTDLVNPAFVYDPAQEIFIHSSSAESQAELWHGLIRAPGKGRDRLDLLKNYFEKNESFYQGDEIFSTFKNQIGFHDQFWENEAIDNETKKWYLNKMSVLDRIMNYRYSGEWLKELSGEAVDRLAELTSRTFEDAAVTVEGPNSAELNNEISFDSGRAASQNNASAARVNSANSDVDKYGGGRLDETVPDNYSPGPIRNFFKDYINVVSRYVSGTAELLQKAGRRQSYETLASLITKMDKFHSSVLYLVGQEFEKYIYRQAEELALNFELIDQYEQQNFFYSEEANSAIDTLKNQDAPPPYEDIPKSNPLGYGSKVFHRNVNGVRIDTVESVENCSLERGSNIVSEAGEEGSAVTLLRKDNPLTAQDISGVSGRKAKEEIKQVYKDHGYCSYMVKDQCIPGASRVPLLDYGASEKFEGENDYRRCFDHDGPTVPKDVEKVEFHQIPSIVNHTEPSGETVRAMLEKKLAHYFPIDAVRHVSFYIGGAGQYSVDNVGRISYPNFFEVLAAEQAAVITRLQEFVLEKERELRKLRVEANWKRYAQYLAYSTPVAGRNDFWNYNEMPGFEAAFQQYQAAVLGVLRAELAPGEDLDDFELVERYLLTDKISEEKEKEIQELLVKFFPSALAKQDLDLACDYSYEVPPINIDIKIPEVTKDDAQALMNPIAAFDLLSKIDIPKFSPPSISRECSATVAKNTVEEAKSLRVFYYAPQGVTVNLALLHDSDKFVEVMAANAVLLYFTPDIPPIVPGTNIGLAINMFNSQLQDLENGPQPVTRLTKVVKPVALKTPGELESIFQKYAQSLKESLNWLNLNIEGKHKEGLKLLSKDKEMLFLVMDGEADHLDLNLSQLEGNFSPDEDSNIASGSDVLDKVREGERALKERQEENRKKRELESRSAGERQSKCGDSVPLLQWAQAVSCWLTETLSGPLIGPTSPAEAEANEANEANEAHAFIRQVTSGDLQIGSADTLEFEVEIRGRDDKVKAINTKLKVFADSQGVEIPADIQIENGKGQFTISAGTKAGMTGISVGSEEVSTSSVLYINTISGEPARVVWDFGDKVVGLDKEIQGTVSVQDKFANPYRSEGLRLELSWGEGMEINGKTGGRGTFFLVAGQLALRVRIGDELYEDLSVEPKVKIELVSDYPDLQIPDEIVFDINQDYRVGFFDVPEKVQVGDSIPVFARVKKDDEALTLNKKVFAVQREFAGAVEFVNIPMTGTAAGGIIPAVANSGIMKIIIDDPDFGSVIQEIEVLGQKSSKLQLDKASYTTGKVDLEITGKDSLGNGAALPEAIANIKVIGEGGEELYKKATVIEGGILQLSLPLTKSPDRVRLEANVEGFKENFSETLALEQKLSVDQLRSLPWGTPYLVLVGSGFGDYRADESVAQAMLFGGNSKLQAVTTEIAPHHTYEKSLQIWPSGRVIPGLDTKVEVVWDSFKPVLVHSDRQGELGRLYINPRELEFVVSDIPDGSFSWKKSEGRGKAILVPESPEWQDFISFENNQVSFKELDIKTEVFDDSGDVLIFEFSRQQKLLARWYLDLNAAEVLVNKVGALQWQFSGSRSKDHSAQYFYAGEGTLDEKGLVIYKKGKKLKNSLGNGRSALDDARENNGQGFFGDDKSALAFLAGNTVGESTILQSEAIVNFGDPVISMKQLNIPEADLSAENDFSIGQMVYAPEEGKIQNLLRADVEGDGDDDLIIVLKIGERVVLRYLEGHGEGNRWGEVTNLLDLGKDVLDVQVLQKKHFVVLYGSGQLLIEQNILGKYVRQLVDTARVSEYQIEDFDKDGLGDLLFLTGDRELWIWYGMQTLEGIQFGIREVDRKLLRTLSIKLKDPDNFETAAWLMTSSTPNFLASCRENQQTCQSKYFRSFTGTIDSGADEEIDRLQLLIDQSDVEAKFEEESEITADGLNYMVRLDQLENYKNTIDIKLLNAVEGTGMRLNQTLDFKVAISPARAEKVFVLSYDLGTDFRLKGNVSCDGCTNTLQVRGAENGLWSLEGELPAGRVVTLLFSVEYVAFPDFSFQVMSTNGDKYPDIGLNVSANTSGRITVFESRSSRDYSEIIFGKEAAASSAAANESKELSDLMKGIGLEGKTTAEVLQLLMKKQDDIEASAGELFNDVHEDKNGDGYPDVYQENSSLLPDKKVDNKQSAIQGGFLDWFSFLIPEAKAQNELSLGPDAIPGLENTQAMLDDISTDVENIINILKCSRGCLPLPMNFAFLAPGPINLFGKPGPFDPGLPVFGLSAAPFFIWPPLVAYQITQFRFYISPTLTGGIGLGLCLGPYPIGQCMTFAIPTSQFGGEALCDAAKQGLDTILQGIYSAVGQVNAVMDQAQNEINKTGVVKASRPKNTEAIEGIVGVSLGGGTHDQGVNPFEPKINLSPIPKIFVDWWDRQWEEIINSLTDLPDITVRLPALQDAFGDKEYYEKLQAKVSDSVLINLGQLYDLINSLPIIKLHPKVLTIQIPWIEPGMLRRIEQSLYKFVFDFITEMVAFLKSFNLPCNVTVVQDEFFTKVREKVATGRSEFTEQEIIRLQSQLEDTSVSLATADQEFKAFLDREGIQAEVEAERKKYFDELQEKRSRVANLNKEYEKLENELSRIDQPQKISDTVRIFGDVVKETAVFWKIQAEAFLNWKNLKKGTSRVTAEALRSCLAVNVGVDLTADVTDFVDGIRNNIDALETWKRFPRELAKYLNALEFYIQEVIKIVDQLTKVALDWWTEFERKLDLWIDVIFSYQEFIALVKMLLDILKGYNKKCGLCTSDRLTLKEFIMKILFGVVPKFPIIDFPTWPDVRLDFSDVQLAMDISVPAFDVKTIDLRWPELPQIKFPRFQDLNLSASGDLSLNFSVKLPEIPLVIPAPPALPPLLPLPNIPEINLPNLPPAPEVPTVLESLLPMMKIIQTILDIWCLVNKALIPIDERLLKTQIENLTNRSLNLILPIDLMLELDFTPGQMMADLVPFDLIDVKSTFRAGVNVDPLPDLQKTVDEQFHEPMNVFLRQIDNWFEQLKESSQADMDEMRNDLQGLVDKVQIDEGIKLERQDDFSTDLKKDFPELQSNLINQRKEGFISYYSGIKNDLLNLGNSLDDLNSKPAEDLLGNLASLSGENVLVSSAPSLLKQLVSEEKRKFLYSEENMVEKKISLVEKPKLLAQLNQSRSDLENVQEQMLGDSAGLEQWGTAVVRDGEVRRIQDYPLQDPAVAVWDNDVFLGYEDAVYIKSIDGSPRRAEAYQGRIREFNLDTLQRSAVHQLKAETISDGQAGEGSVTVRWSWDAPGVEDVELSIWDTVGKAQRLDSRHLKFYLRQADENLANGYFESPGFPLEEGRELLAKNDLNLKYGEDRILIPAGMVFEIPSLIAREIRVRGAGTVGLENNSGKDWVIGLADESNLAMEGVADLQANGGKIIRIPALESRPVVTRINAQANGFLRSRVEVSSGEEIPAGQFYTLSTASLLDQFSGAELDLPTGFIFEVKENDSWKIVSGKGQSIVSDDLQFTEARKNMLLMDNELLRGDFTVSFEDTDYKILTGQEVVWSAIEAQSFEVTLPLGNYYGRIRGQDANRGFSQIVHAAAAQKRFAASQILAGVEKMAIPIHTPLEINGRDFVIGDLPEESFHWRLAGEENFVTGYIYRHPGFDSTDDRTVELYIRNGENDFLSKTFVVSVFLPILKLNEDLFENLRVISIQTQPPVAGIPIGVVGERDGVQDWLIMNPDKGVRLENQYYSDENGLIQLPSLEALEGMNIVIEGDKNVARLYPNGRVMINEEYKDECQVAALLDVDGYVKFRVSCLDDGRLVMKFEVRMIPERDTDVSIVAEFSAYDRGVSVKSVLDGIVLTPIDASDSLAPGGVRVAAADGSVLMIIFPDGKVELLDKNISVIQKPFSSPGDLLVWQALRNDLALLEFVIRGPDRVAIIDHELREEAQGDQDNDGMLDKWEELYGISSPSEDPDLDNLTNLQEFQAGTHPKIPDTDGDGLADGEEVNPVSAESRQKKIVFGDISESSPYYEAIQTLLKFGFIQGYEDGTFRPDQAVTRAEALKIIMSVIRCENCEMPAQATKDEFDPLKKGIDDFIEFHDGLFTPANPETAPEKIFSFDRQTLGSLDPRIGSYFDVKENDWFYYCVEIASKLGLVHGYRGFENGENALGKFIPNRGVNIAELMKIVIEAIGKDPKPSEKVYGASDGWWNDPANNYLATAEEELQLLISSEDYSDPLRQATRAEVAYAAWRVLKENGALNEEGEIVNGCPAAEGGLEYGPVIPKSMREREDLFEGIEISQAIECKCLVVIPADLFIGAQFFAVITGTGNESDKVLVKSNVVGGGGGD